MESLKRALQRRHKNGVHTSGSMAVEAIVRVFAGNVLSRLIEVNVVYSELLRILGFVKTGTACGMKTSGMRSVDVGKQA